MSLGRGIKKPEANNFSFFWGIRYLVAGTTVWSGLSYVFSKDAVKILSDEDIHQRLARQRRAKEIEDEQKKL